MAKSYQVCIEAPPINSLIRNDQDERYILHVRFNACGTDTHHYKADYERLESTLLTKFLTADGEDHLHEILMKLTFEINSPQEANAFCENVLEKGIYCFQHEFNFLGHSETQLKRKSCYLMRASHKGIHDILTRFGRFLEERDLRRRARKIGMLFTPLNKAHKLNTTQCEIKPDVRSGFFRPYTFTDGCGFMSPKFSAELQKNLKIAYQPSVVQVRYRGIEGLLVLNEDLAESKVQFRESMQKFETRDEEMPKSLKFIDVVDYSRPHEYGYLDTRMIMSLVEGGVPAQNLIDLQSTYHELLERMCKQVASAEYFSRFKGDFGLLSKLKATGIDSQAEKRLKFFRDQEIEEMKKTVGGARILVPKSRLVFAVCDPYNTLKPGECYFNPTMSEEEAETFPGIDETFLVTRSSCYHPGDLRLLRLRDDKLRYENLRDCLVLPVQGKRPHAFECAGGNLGGHKYFVSWNEELFPKEVRKPCDYRVTKTRKSLSYVAFSMPWSFRNDITPKKIDRGRREMRQYFSSFTEDLTERIHATYMKYAAAFGPSSKQCQQLCKLFHHAVNLTEERVTLERKWSKLRDKEPPATECSAEPSAPSPFCNERSPLMTTEEGRSNEPNRQPRFRFMRKKKQLPNHSNVLREKMETASKQFVQRFQR